MSKILAGTGYDGQLWLDHELGHTTYTFEWEGHTVIFSPNGYRISTEFNLTEEEQVELITCLAKKDPSLPPHWQSLTPNLHRLVERMTNQILDAANKADLCLRKLPKGIRLSPLKFRERQTSSNQKFPVINWKLSEDELKKFMPVFEDLGPASVNGYRHGIDIPMPIHFERRQVHLTEEEVNKISEHLTSELVNEPFKKLYAIALDNFTKRSYSSAILILATSIETALKLWLNKCGDPISKYLISNVQSPPIDKLYSCARKNTEINVPKHYTAWLVKLRTLRNDIAHKPEPQVFNRLQIARWFAIGEAILSAIEGYTIDPMVGYIVEPIGEKANDNFPPDSKGVILRREVLYEVNSYHVVLDSGQTWRFGEDAFKKSDIQVF